METVEFPESNLRPGLPARNLSPPFTRFEHVKTRVDMGCETINEKYVVGEIMETPLLCNQASCNVVVNDFACISRQPWVEHRKRCPHFCLSKMSPRSPLMRLRTTLRSALPACATREVPRWVPQSVQSFFLLIALIVATVLGCRVTHFPLHPASMIYYGGTPRTRGVFRSGHSM